MKYDLFISYRRKDSSGRTNVPTARQFKQAFEGPLYNYKVFFDYSECTDNYFSDIILPAIRTCDFFVLVLTKDCLSRCFNEGDWVRREIEEAIAYKRKIIPITPDKECDTWPDLPNSLSILKGLQITTIYTDHMFESGVDFLVKNRFHLNGGALEVDEKIKRQENAGSNETAGRPNLSKKATNIFNGHEYIDFGLPSGTLWATCNVGATKPEDCGDYFSWGEIEPKIDYSKKCYSYTNDDPAKANWGGNWLLPTIKQWEELLKYTTNMYVNLDGVRGRLFTSSKKERLFLPAAGFYMGRRICFNNRHGYYWSNSLRDGHPTEAKGFFFSSGRFYKETALDGGWSRDSGFSVRPVCSAK